MIHGAGPSVYSLLNMQTPSHGKDPRCLSGNRTWSKKKWRWRHLLRLSGRDEISFSCHTTVRRNWKHPVMVLFFLEFRLVLANRLLTPQGGEDMRVLSMWLRHSSTRWETCQWVFSLSLSLFLCLVRSLCLSVTSKSYVYSVPLENSNDIKQ